MRVFFSKESETNGKLVKIGEILNGEVGMVKIKTLSEREFTSKKQVAEYKARLKELTDKSSLPAFLGELFLNEIKISTDEANAHLRERARLLRLL